MIYQTTNPGVRYEYWHPLGPPFRPPPGGGRRGRGRGQHHAHLHTRGPASLQAVLPAYLARPGENPGDRSLGLDPMVLAGQGSATQGVGGPDPARSQPTWKVWKFTPCSRTCGGGEAVLGLRAPNFPKDIYTILRSFINIGLS